ncbi:MAG: hypothetical protein ACOYT7_02125 [Patescibacteria group bacterium]
MQIDNPSTAEQTSTKSNKLPLLAIGAFVILVAFFFVLGILIKKGVLLCRNVLGRPYLTGIVSEAYEFEDEGFQDWKTTACIRDIQSVSADEAFIEIGYFDKFWWMHIYKARLGGKSPLVGVCTSDRCSAKTPEEFIGSIKKGDLVELFIVTRDKNFQLLDSSELADSYLSFIEKLKAALLQKTSFPKSEQVIQISEIMIPR